jgi:hypothetical protein
MLKNTWTEFGFQGTPGWFLCDTLRGEAPTFSAHSPAALFDPKNRALRVSSHDTRVSHSGLPLWALTA